MNNDTIVKRAIYTPSDLHVREAEDGKLSRRITGYAILFNSKSAPFYEDEAESVYEMIAPEAITRDFLDTQDIKMTMFHDMHLILARSLNGKGTLSYDVDEKGVSFEFDAPNTVDGDKALELVSRGDISGCSFMFSTRYADSGYVSRESKIVGSRKETVFTVRKLTGLYDFTLTPDPAYPETECSTRELVEQLRREPQAEPKKASTDITSVTRSIRMILNEV